MNEQRFGEKRNESFTETRSREIRRIETRRRGSNLSSIGNGHHKAYCQRFTLVDRPRH